MGYSFDRTDDGLIILRELVVEADLPTVLWYLKADDEGAVRSRSGPSFARARRTGLRRKGSAPVPGDGTSHGCGRPVEGAPGIIDAAIARGVKSFAPVACLRFDPVRLNDERQVLLDGIEFQSRRLSQLLEGCDECAVFATTLGHGIEEEIRSASTRGDADVARALEAVAAAGLLDLTQRIQRRIELIARKEGKRVTHCQWPGFCDWSTGQTERLMSRLDVAPGQPVRWSGDCFVPAWSFVGLVGLGHSVSRVANNPCRRCDNRRYCRDRIW